MSDPPEWQRRVTDAQAAIAPHLQSALHHDTTLTAIALLRATRAGVERRVEQASRRVLHLFNLPAGSDVTRLFAQIAALQHQVRELTKILEDLRPGPDDGPDDATDDATAKEAKHGATRPRRRADPTAP